MNYKIRQVTRGNELFEIKLDEEDFYRLEKQSVWISAKGYPVIWNFITKKKIMLHRFIMNDPHKMQVDHINHDILDARKCNLRVATAAENSSNRKLASNNTSGYRGIIKTTNGKWRALVQSRTNIKHNFSATFNTKEEAIQAVQNFRANIGYLDKGKLPQIQSVGPKNRRGAKQGLWVGVYWHKSRQVWISKFKFQNKEYYCGSFSTREEAKLALEIKKQQIIK